MLSVPGLAVKLVTHAGSTFVDANPQAKFAGPGYLVGRLLQDQAGRMCLLAAQWPTDCPLQGCEALAQAGAMAGQLTAARPSAGLRRTLMAPSR